MLKISTLPNGLRVVTEAMPGIATSAVGIWVGAGARNETAANNGVAHMLEHMAFKGTEQRSARAIAEEIEAVGGHLNAYTSREQTAYYARTLADDVPLALDILADILQRSTFAPDELERERGVILQEIGQANDTPDDIVFDYLQEAAYPGQAIGRPILGSEANVSAMSRDQLAGFMGAHYTAGDMVLSAAGAVDHDRIVAQAGALFGSLAQQASARDARPVYAAGERREERDLDQAHLALGFNGVPFGDPDFYAVQVYSALLGGGMSSRLFQEIREKRGLAYSVFSFSTSYRDGGMFSLYAGTNESDLVQLVPVIAGEMNNCAGKVESAEVARARAQLKAGLLMSLESPGSRAEQFGRQMLIHGRILDTSEIIAAVDAVDEAAVQRVAGRILKGGAPAVAAVGPVGALASHDRIAAQFA
jgi:predicted Zn-dependent peptidase